MDELSPRSKDLLETFKADATPDAPAVEAALAAVQQGAASSPATASGVSVGAKVALTGVVGAIAVAAWIGTRPGTPPPATAPVAAGSSVEPEPRPEPQPEPPLEPQAPTPRDPGPASPAAPTETAALEPEATPNRSGAASTPGSKKRPSAPRSEEPASAPEDRLAREVKLMAGARAALKRGDGDRAYQLLRTHEREFPAGAFAEQAAALRVDALCQLGRTEEAAGASARFVERWPGSPSVARVRQICDRDGP